jgi:hypothetical protein
MEVSSASIRTVQNTRAQRTGSKATTWMIIAQQFNISFAAVYIIYGFYKEVSDIWKLAVSLLML